MSDWRGCDPGSTTACLKHGVHGDPRSGSTAPIAWLSGRRLRGGAVIHAGLERRPTACHPEPGPLPESKDLPTVGRSLRPRTLGEGGIDPRTFLRFFDSLADSVAQNDMSMGVAKRRGGAQGDMVFVVFVLLVFQTRPPRTTTVTTRVGALSRNLHPLSNAILCVLCAGCPPCPPL